MRAWVCARDRDFSGVCHINNGGRRCNAAGRWSCSQGSIGCSDLETNVDADLMTYNTDYDDLT